MTSFSLSSQTQIYISYKSHTWIIDRMLLVTRGHHELDEEKVPDQASLSDIGQVWYILILRKKNN